MAWSDIAAGIDEAVFDNLTDGLASWSNVADPVQIIVSEPDETTSYGPGQLIRPTRTIHVRRCDVPSPAMGQTVTLGPRVFRLLAQPLIDEEGTVWACQAEEVVS